MKQKIYLAASIALILLAIGANLYFYDALPASMAAHWNVRGEADGTLEKNVVLAITPLAAAIILIISIALPRLDPLGHNIRKFQTDVRLLILIIVGLLVYLHGLVIAWNLGARFEFGRMLSPAFAALFFVLGSVLGKAKRNWFIGVRTPWTLSSDKVWERTHKQASKLFKFAAGFILLGLFLRRTTITLIIIPAVIISAYLVIFSYYAYRAERRKR